MAGVSVVLYEVSHEADIIQGLGTSVVTDVSIQYASSATCILSWICKISLDGDCRGPNCTGLQACIRDLSIPRPRSRSKIKVWMMLWKAKSNITLIRYLAEMRIQAFVESYSGRN